MKKKLTQFRWLAAMIMLVAAMVMPSVAWAENTITPSQPTSGDGSSASPYQISTAAELYWFAGLVNGDKSVCNYDEKTNPYGTQQNKAACAVLTANIVVNSGIAKGKTMLESLEYDASGKVTNGSSFVAWTPIGFNYQNYTGTFDGQGHTVSGLYFNDSSKEKVGLFGYVDSGGKISNVGVLDSYFLFRMFGGGVCGRNDGEISNCYNFSTVVETSSNGYAGGVCGYNYGGKVLNSYNNGIISGYIKTGGVCGYNQNNGEITNCYNSGTVSGKGNANQIAGVCGYNDSNCTISGCYNTGTVSGINSGGVCLDNNGTVKNCYNTGTVSGQNVHGGVCGSNSKGTITSCYNRGEVNGTGGDVGGICGKIGSSSSTTNCYYLSGTANGGIYGSNVTGSAESKTETQFNSGEVALLLNGGKTDGSQAWYQNLSEQSGDAYPVLKSTEGNTVYGGYKHGGNTGKFSNTASVISEGYIHLHAYNSSAADEANGNHDKSYQGNFNWVDNDDKTNATVTATFTCSVCGKVVEPEMTVVHDGEHDNTQPACTEVGFNYFKTSYDFAGAIFTDSYKQTVPALGHYMNIITFKEYDKIYSNKCQRENCGYIGYYATSDGSVEAKYEDGVYKVPFLCLYDAKAYDSKAEYTVDSLTYQRTFSHDKWVAVYVPFAIDCSLLPDYMEMAIVNNFHEYEQTDGSYNVVLEVKRMTSGTIPALTPCVMRLKTELASATKKEIQLSNVPFSAAADNYIDCSSVTRYYKFTGSLAGIAKNSWNVETDFVLNEGTLHKANKETALKAQRWYLTATDRNGSSTSATMLRSISINVIGDSDGDVTGIDDIHVVTEKATSVREGIFDLQGRRLNGEPTNGIYIKNGVKYVK